MSADKHKARARRIALLALALRRPTSPDGEGGQLLLNCLGGVARNNPDIKRLIADGMLRIVRHSWGGPGRLAYAPKRFRAGREPSPEDHCFGRVNITRAVLTPRGVDWLSRSRAKDPRSERT